MSSLIVIISQLYHLFTYSLLLFQIFPVLWILFLFPLYSSSFVFASILRQVPTDWILPPVPPCSSVPSPVLPLHPSSLFTGAKLNKRRWESFMTFLLSHVVCHVSSVSHKHPHINFYQSLFLLCFHVLMRSPVQTEKHFICYWLAVSDASVFIHILCKRKKQPSLCLRKSCTSLWIQWFKVFYNL